jgi:hypothetical protein
MLGGTTHLLSPGGDHFDPILDTQALDGLVEEVRAFPLGIKEGPPGLGPRSRGQNQPRKTPARAKVQRPTGWGASGNKKGPSPVKVILDRARAQETTLSTLGEEIEQQRDHASVPTITTTHRRSR